MAHSPAAACDDAGRAAPAWPGRARAPKPAGLDPVGIAGTGIRKYLAEEILTPRTPTTPMATLHSDASAPQEMPARSKLTVKTAVGASLGMQSCSGSTRATATPTSPCSPSDVWDAKDWSSSWDLDSDDDGHQPHTPVSQRSSSRRASINSTSLGRTSSRRHSAASSGAERSAERRGSVNSNGVERPRFDILTLRQWFNAMDADRSGQISKQEWYEFLRGNPKLKFFILNGNTMPPPGYRDKTTDEAALIRRTEVVEMRRLIKAWRDLDVDGSGSLDFGEFVDFFRSAGNLLEYKTQGHPKARLSALLGEVHENPGRASEASLGELEQLAKHHLHGERRRSVELEALAQCGPESPVAARIHRRHSTQVHLGQQA